MQDILNAISTVGFPIVISLFLMIRIEKVIKSNTEAITSIRLIMDKCSKK